MSPTCSTYAELPELIVASMEIMPFATEMPDFKSRSSSVSRRNAVAAPAGRADLGTGAGGPGGEGGQVAHEGHFKSPGCRDAHSMSTR